jgi:hypothetical protein
VRGRARSPEFVAAVNAALDLREHLPNVENAAARNEVGQLTRLDPAV